MPDSIDVNINTRGKELNSYDAIVIGSGISGGWAAKELCEKGLKTLVLERGRNIEHIKDYPTMNTPTWEFRHRGWITKKQRDENPVISRAAGYDESTQHFFIRDNDHPYIQEKPFDWIRGYQVGGKSLTWGRACARWSEFDFTAPLRYGYAIDWPVRYKELAPWYSHVEKFIGVCGTKEGIESMPDGEFLPAYELNCVEQHLKNVLWDKFKRYYVSGRWAQVTEPNDIQKNQGRYCLNRNLCMRGCPYGGYFSSVTSTLPWAKATGNLTVQPFAVVHSIIYDEQKQKAIGVRVIDANSKQPTEYFSKVIFVNASALNTNLILLNSTSDRFPDGLGNDSGLLGKYICHHNYRASMGGDFEGYTDKYYKVRKPAECIIPNFRNIHKQDTDFLGGYVIFSGAYRESTSDKGLDSTIGGAYKDALCEPGPWGAYMYVQGETIPKETNHVRLSKDKKDQWGIPLLNGWNQMHACKNVFVTDGACMTTTGNQSPSILYMAFTARAANYAAEEMKKGNL